MKNFQCQWLRKKNQIYAQYVKFTPQLPEVPKGPSETLSTAPRPMLTLFPAT